MWIIGILAWISHATGLGPGPLTSCGNPLHQQNLGSGLGAALATSGLWLSIGAFEGLGGGLARGPTSRPKLFAQTAFSLGQHITAGAAVLTPSRGQTQSVGLVTCRPGGRGWIAHGWLQRSSGVGSTSHAWGASLGPYPDGTGSGWALAASGDEENGWKPRGLEASWQLALGDGLVISPGLFVQTFGSSSIVTPVVKSCWNF